MLISAGFVVMLAGLLRWQFAAAEEFELFNVLFLLHMVPFGLALLLNDYPPTGRNLSWSTILDYLQILLMVVILYTGFIYLPSRGATKDQIEALNRYFGFLLVWRNVAVTGGYWTRVLLTGSRRELLALRTMAVYLSIYTAVSAVGQYVFLSVHPWTVWLDLNGSVPMLAAAWLFSQWQDLPSEQKPRPPGLRAVLAVHLIPSMLPILVAILASALAKTQPRLAWFTVDLSCAMFAARLMVAIYSSSRTSEALLQTETRLQSLTDVHQQTEAKNLLLKDLALTDALTGLPNRRAIEEWATPQLNVAAKHHIPLWLVLADLDHFKAVNDTYGHQSGDLVLKKFSEILKVNSRRSDICGRMGGEEFVFVLTHATGSAARLVAERVRSQLEATEFTFGNKRFVVTSSFGIAGSEEAPDPDFNRLLARADRALYAAKRLGRNRVEMAST